MLDYPTCSACSSYRSQLYSIQREVMNQKTVILTIGATILLQQPLQILTALKRRPLETPAAGDLLIILVQKVRQLVMVLEEDMVKTSI